MNLLRNLVQVVYLKSNPVGRRYLEFKASFKEWEGSLNPQDLLGKCAELEEQSQSTFGENHWVHAFVLNFKGRALIRMERYGDALACFELSLQIQERKYGTPDDRVAETLGLIAKTLFDWGRSSEARLATEKAYQMHGAVRGDSHWQTVLLKLRFSMCLMQEGSFDRAEEVLEEVRPMIKRNHPRYFDLKASFAYHYAEYFWMQKRIEEAEDVFTDLLHFTEPPHPLGMEHCIAHQRLGEINLHEQENRLAQKYLSQALELSVDFYGENHGHTRVIKELLKSIKL